MGTQLKNIVRYVNLPVGVPTAVLHRLNENGRDVLPDVLTKSEGASGVSLTANATQVIATNNGLVPKTFDVLCEHWHTIERDFGDAADLELVPQPFVACCGSDEATRQSAMFYGLTDSETPVTVAAGAAVPFPLAGPATPGSGIVAGGTNQFVLPLAGLYRVSWSVDFLSSSQLQAALGGVGIANTLSMAGKAAGEGPDVADQNSNVVLVQATAGQLLSVINPAGNATLTLAASEFELTHEQAPSLVIEFIG